jgi:tetratricopeptide (TPR) repeat protein
MHWRKKSVLQSQTAAYAADTGAGVNVQKWVGALVLVSSIAGVGRAQDTTAVPAQTAEVQTQDYRDKAARGLFEAGSVAFEEGRFEEALNHFSKAYELSPNRHLLLYNIGSSLDRLRRDKEALSNFERYLELNPTAPNRPAVEARVRLLRDAVARQQREEDEERKRKEEEEARRIREIQPAPTPAAETPASETPASETPEKSKGVSPVFTYVGAGLTLALGGVAVWSGLNTLDANKTYEDWAKDASPSDKNYKAGKDLYDDGVKRQIRTDILIGSAATVGVVTAVVAVFFTDWKGEKPPATAKVQAFASPTGAGMELRHAF